MCIASAFNILDVAAIAGIFSFSSSSYSFSENAGLVNVKIVRHGGASGQVKVAYRLSNPTQATAVNNKNFILTDSVYQVHFDENQREGFINFKIINDAVYEAKEFFYLEISSMLPTKASDPTTSVAKYGAPRSTIVFIADDGDAGVFNFASSYIYCREDNGSAVLTVLRDQGASSSSYMPVKLSITTLGVSGGSNATEGKSQAFDYLGKSEQLNWANGELRKTFAVKIFNNKKYESKTRAVKVKMSGVEGGATIGVQFESWIYIIDDRDAGTLSFKLPHYKVLESGSSVTVEIVRTGVPDSTNINTYASGNVTVDVATYAGTIVPGKNRYDLDYDYGVVRDGGCTHTSPCTAPEGLAYAPIQSTTLTFAEGELSKLVTISIRNDDLFQAPNRVFKVILQNVTGGAHLGVDYEHPSEWYGYREAYLALEKRNPVVLDNVGTIVTIEDDGDPAVVVSKASLSISEIGQHDAFRVRLNSQPSADVTITLAYDASRLVTTSAALVFTSTNWSESQIVNIASVPNNKSEGLHLTRINVSCVSTDSMYSSPFRVDPQTTGCVLGLGIFTQRWGEYETGNALHQYLWSESEGVLTAPVEDDYIAVFIFDDDHAGVSIRPEKIRHGSGVNVPENSVSVRRNGHNATVGVSITSEPEADVRVSLVPESNSGVAVEPESFIITPSAWTDTFDVKIVAVAIDGQADAENVQFTSVSVFVSSERDTMYNQSTSAMDHIFVQRFPSALVLLDSSVATIREGAGESEQVVYSIGIGSEPMHWEPSAGVYSPHEFVLKAEADTALVFPSTSTSAFGGASTIAVASNSSKSTDKHMVKSMGVLKFNVHPSVASNTGSSQVGSARLRLFRVSGGENGGLGGVRVGVATGLAAASEDWDENLLKSNCTDVLENGGVCSVVNGGTSLPLFFPQDTAFHNISSRSDGETGIRPFQEFNQTSDSYTPASGWLEIDVTCAVNRFLSGVSSGSPSKAMTFLVYSRSTAAFNYDGVDEVVLASKEYVDIELRPELRVTSSGIVNLALKASVSQSCPGSAKAAIDGKTSSKIGLSSTYALSAATYKYPWWQADLAVARAIESIVITVKKKASAASMDDSKLETSFWVFLASSSLSSNNNGLSGFSSAKVKALFAKQFKVTTRSFTASDSETITFRWDVNGERDGAFGMDRFVGDYSTPAAIRYVMIQVEGENNIMLNEVEIYQQAFASARVSIGGFMPSPSVTRAGRNQLQVLLPALKDTDIPECDTTTAICRRELVFTSGNWRVPQPIGVKVFDDAVAMGDHDVHISHSPESYDPDFNEGSQCELAVPSGSISCRNAFFNDTSVKTLRILEDDENKIVLSTHTLGLVEGSRNFPAASVFVRQASLMPAFFRCSSSIDLLPFEKDGATECIASFKPGTSVNWETCISNASASPLESGSAWMMAGFATGMNITSIDIVIPQMLGAKYIRRLSVWGSRSMAMNDSTSDFSDLANGWDNIRSFDVTMKSSGTQTFSVDNLDLFPVQVLLIAFEKSYDEAKQCVTAPVVRITGFEAVPFPLAIRGDLADPNSIPPSQSHLSRMHLYGKSDVVQVQLASEPVADVLVSAVVEEKNNPVVVFDAANKSDVTSTLVGSSYESGDVRTYTMATAIKFTPTNWYVPQELTFSAVDDNFFNGNRTFVVSHTASSEDTVVATTPYQTFDGQTVKKGLKTLPPSLSYTKADYIVSDHAVANWPRHRNPAWTSPTGAVEVAVVDDDLPGVTITASRIEVPESGPSGKYSVFLDSAPFQDVMVKISYEEDDKLLHAEPLELRFTVANWYEPQFVFLHPVANDVYDGELPFTVEYEALIPKAKKPLLLHKVESLDASYNGIQVGSNEYDRLKPYVLSQGVQVVILDDDTGCHGEYTCQNSGECVAKPSGYVCNCPRHYGMRDCSATCERSRDCMFSRVALRLKCLPNAVNAICGSTFSASTLVSTLHRMLGSNEFTAASGKTYSKLSLGPVSEVMYVVNSTTAECVDSSGECIAVWMDFPTASASDLAVLEKLKGYAESGSLRAEPFYAELVTAEGQYRDDPGATIAVWIFIGFCGLCVAAVALLFTARLVRAKRSHVTPDLGGGGRGDDADEGMHAMRLTDLIHATVPTSPKST